MLSVGVVTALSPGIYPEQTAAVGDTVFFTRTESGTEPDTVKTLWRSDGTAPGTLQIKDPTDASKPLTLTGIALLKPLGSSLLIDVGEQDLYRVDAGGATQATTIPVPAADLVSDPNGVVLGGTYYFVRAVDRSTQVSHQSDQLWRTDGTAAGTSFVQDIQPQSTNGSLDHAFIGEFAVSGSRLFFSARTEGNGSELWTSDGTPAGTHIVVDLVNGSDSSGIGQDAAPRSFMPIDANRLMFVTNVSDRTDDGSRLWVSDGTAKGTLQLAQDTEFLLPVLSPAQKLAYFEHNGEIWRSDGSPAGTFAIVSMDFFTESNSFGDQFYFRRGGSDWLRTDGTIQGTVTGAPPFDLGFENYAWPVALGGQWLFNAKKTGGAGYALYSTNGTTADTRQLTDEFPATRFTIAGSRAYLFNSDTEIDRTILAVYDPAAGSIVGTVFDDKNGNGARDAGEDPLRGYKVFIDRNGDGVCNKNERWTRASSTGRYRFDLLPAGMYVIRIVGAAGKRASTPEQYRLRVRGDQTVTRYFGRSDNVLLAGLVYMDANKNGTIDNGEAGMVGWTVYVDADRDGTLDDAELRLVTDVAGKFAFTSLPAGSYQLRVVPQAGYRATSPGAGYRSATLPASAVTSKLNFGAKRLR